MSKSTQIDRLSAERTALSVQLDDARARLTAFEKQAKRERERTLDDLEAGGTSGMKGIGSNGEMLTGKGKVRPLPPTRTLLSCPHTASVPHSLTLCFPMLLCPRLCSFSLLPVVVWFMR